MTVYFDPVAFVYCVGFWGSVHFFRLSRNGYFKIESRPDARLTLPRPNTMVFGVFRVRNCARATIHGFRRRSRNVSAIAILKIKTGSPAERRRMVRTCDAVAFIAARKDQGGNYR